MQMSQCCSDLVADGRAFSVWRSILVPEAERDCDPDHLQSQLQHLLSNAATKSAGNSIIVSPVFRLIALQHRC